MKQFVKAFDKDGDCFNYIPKPFLVSAGNFDGPKVCKLKQGQTFTARMTVAERAAWCSYVSVIQEFLGNTKTSNYRNFVDMMLQDFQALGARLSIKLYCLFSHLHYFPESW